MNYVYQFTIIAAISFIGEILNRLVPLPVPASVYGLLILMACLCTGIIKLKQVEGAAGFFLDIMPVLFVASSASLMTIVSDLTGSIGVLLFMAVLSTTAVFAATGLSAQAVIRYQKKRRENKGE